MQTNFFRQLANLQLTGDLQIILTKTSETQYLASILLKNEQCGDEAKKSIPPLNLRGTAEELDNGFFENITTPLQTASGLMVDMEAFLKQLEEAKKQSAMEKEKVDKQKKEQETKDKKFRDGMARVDALEKEGKFRDAWIKIPDITEFPEKTDEIRKRKTSLSNKFGAPSLFGVMPEDEKSEPSQEDNLLDYPMDETDNEEQNY